MYLSFFELRTFPFAMTPDPSRLYLTARHRECLAGLVYAILSRKGLIVLTGEVGAGKSILVARLQEVLPVRVKTTLIAHPTLSADDFLDALLLGFGVADVPGGKARRLLQLRRFLTERQSENAIPVLVVDEAQTLSITVLEELRLLSNLEHGCEKLLQIVLVGQLELDGIMRQQKMAHLKQRIAVRLRLDSLHTSEVEGYIQHRWTQAGGAFHPFSREALETVGVLSERVPRLINALCDNALLLAFAEQNRSVSLAHILEAANDLDIRTSSLRNYRAEPAPSQVLKRDAVLPVNGETAPAPGALRVPVFAQATAKPSFMGRVVQRFRLV